MLLRFATFKEIDSESVSPLFSNRIATFHAGSSRVVESTTINCRNCLKRFGKAEVFKTNIKNIFYFLVKF